MDGPQSMQFGDGRLHLHHGPIDLIIESVGPGRDASYGAARARFQTVLQELADELPLLRRPIAEAPSVQGRIARRMAAAATSFAPAFVTPMAAVAGAVADEIIGVVGRAPGLEKAYVNNGGDVALWLAPGAAFDGTIFARSEGRFRIDAAMPVRGVATSGWQGRSHSLGIAESVTVLAETAAIADVAATLIANAVDLPGHPAIRRRPARDLAPDSDLGDRLVTVDVGPLSPEETAEALDRGAAYAAELTAKGLIHAAVLLLDGDVRDVSPSGR